MQIAYIPLPAGFKKQRPDKIIIHSMAEFIEMGEIDYPAWEHLRRIGLSAHAFVTATGVVVRSRGDTQGAYHARGFNAHSLGLEFLVPGVHTYATFLAAIRQQYLTHAQVMAGLTLVKQWVQKWDIPKSRLYRHSDLTGKKPDPGNGFPWEWFVRSVYA